MGKCLSTEAGAAEVLDDGEPSRTYILQKGEHISKYLDLGDEEVLGEGMTGQVTKAVHLETGEAVAVKRVSKHVVKDMKALRMEIKFLSTLRHRNVVKLKAAYEDSKMVYMVLELCPGGDLLDRLLSKKNHRYTEAEVRSLVRQMISAVGYVHAKGICHRDLKMDNWLFARGGNEKNPLLKLIDFGLSKKHYKEHAMVSEMKTFLGTPGFLAPEIQRAYYGELEKYDDKVDLWSIGVIAYSLISGKMPFKRRAQDCVPLSDKLERSYKAHFLEPFWVSEVSDECKDFLNNLLDPDPETRFNAKQALIHRWLKSSVNRASTTSFDPQMLGRLTSFSKEEGKRKAAMGHIAENLLPNDILELRQAFVSVDNQRNGFISWEEAKNAIESTSSKKSLQKLFSKMVVDMEAESGIAYTSFLAGAMDHCMLHNKRILRESFQAVDAKKAGLIALSKISSVFAKAPIIDPKAFVAAAKSRYESLNDGDDAEVSFQQFCNLLDDVHHEKIKVFHDEHATVADVKVET